MDDRRRSTATHRQPTQNNTWTSANVPVNRLHAHMHAYLHANIHASVGIGICVCVCKVSGHTLSTCVLHLLCRMREPTCVGRCLDCDIRDWLRAILRSDAFHRSVWAGPNSRAATLFLGSRAGLAVGMLAAIVVRWRACSPGCEAACRSVGARGGASGAAGARASFAAVEAPRGAETAWTLQVLANVTCAPVVLRHNTRRSRMSRWSTQC